MEIKELLKDHSEMIAKIPKYFYQALLGELISVFGVHIIELGEKIGDLHSSSSGWWVALQQTCEKLNMNWLIQYHESLEWYDSDILDGELEKHCCELISKEDKKMEYYSYLFDKYEQQK